MEVVTWILLVVNSVALIVLIVLEINLRIKLLYLAKGAKQVVDKGQQIADDTSEVVKNIAKVASVGGLAKSLFSRYNKRNSKDKSKSE